MKVFISWSGDAAKAAATALGDCVRDVFSGVEPWISVNIDPGARWFEELTQALADSRFAVVCVTKATLQAPWIMFESGALATHFEATKVVPLLLDCTVDDLENPLARFNATTFDKESVRRLFSAINASLDTGLNPLVLQAAFDTIWPRFEAAVKAGLTLETSARRHAYDVFLSAPMASLKTDAEYQPFRSEVMKVADALRKGCNLRVFCALDTILSVDDFDLHGVSARDDLDALRKSSSFVMLYPQKRTTSEKLATSALFEAGYALALGLPSRFFVKDEEDLPYLMQRLPEAATHVSILDHRDWSTYDDIAEALVKNADRWFRRAAIAELKD